MKSVRLLVRCVNEAKLKEFIKILRKTMNNNVCKTDDDNVNVYSIDAVRKKKGKM